MKGVYVKGSDLGYSLSTIERILAKSQQEKQILVDKEYKKDHQQVLSQPSNQHRNLENGLEKEMKPYFSKVWDDVTNPTLNHDTTIPSELRKKEKDKKRPSQHL
jgi:hypothetical protein